MPCTPDGQSAPGQTETQCFSLFQFMNTRPAAAPTLNRKQSRKGTRGGDYENEEADPGGTRRTSCDVDPGKYVDPGKN